MTVRSNATAVGAFVLGALAIAVGIAVVFGSGLLFKDVTRYVIFFEGSLEGLGVGAPVKYRGVQIGQVVSITPSFEQQERSINIPVVIELTRDAVEGVEEGGKTMEVLTKEGLRARLELASLITGQLSGSTSSRAPRSTRRRIGPTILRSRQYLRCRPGCSGR